MGEGLSLRYRIALNKAVFITFAAFGGKKGQRFGVILKTKMDLRPRRLTKKSVRSRKLERESQEMPTRSPRYSGGCAHYITRHQKRICSLNQRCPQTSATINRPSF